VGEEGPSFYLSSSGPGCLPTKGEQQGPLVGVNSMNSTRVKSGRRHVHLQQGSSYGPDSGGFKPLRSKTPLAPKAERLRLCAILNKLLSGQKSGFFRIVRRRRELRTRQVKQNPMGMKVVSQG
jgi:hypothetical protein